MRITFGDTDGDCEAKLVGQLAGYNVCVYTTDEGSQDAEILQADSVGISTYLLNDDGERIPGSRGHSYEWLEIEEIHVY